MRPAVLVAPHRGWSHQLQFECAVKPLSLHRRSTTLPWGDETFAIMGTRSIQEIVAEVGQQPAPVAKPAPQGIQLTAHAAAA